MAFVNYIIDSFTPFPLFFNPLIPCLHGRQAPNGGLQLFSEPPIWGVGGLINP